MVEISSERDSPVRPVTIEEEIPSMPIGSSLVLKKKRKGENPSSLMSRKRQSRTFTREAEEATQMGPSSSRVMELESCIGVSIEDIPGYILPYFIIFCIFYDMQIIIQPQV